MAYVNTRVRRVVLGVVLVGSVVATFVPPVAGADPASGPARQPSVADVQKQLSALVVKNSQLIEQYNQAQIEVSKRQTAATQAKKVAVVATDKYAVARLQLAQTAAAQYEGGAFSSTGALLSSDSGASYLQQLETLTMISAHSAQVVAGTTVARQDATAAKAAAKTLLLAAQAKLQVLASKRAKVEAQLKRYGDLLGTLTAQQRAAYQRQANPTVPAAVVTQQRAKFKHLATASGHSAADQAVKFALAQVGKPYSYGAAGPDSFDCSGLTMASYASAGISLPHSAAAQSGYGHAVAYGQWIPGDLLFYYSPIGHVTIYIGNGLMVSAPETGENVRVMPVNVMSGYVGSTRPVS